MDSKNTNSVNNNNNGKNTHSKTCFNFYNNISTNADMSIDDINDTKNNCGIHDVDNNFNNKKAYIKAVFNIYNIASKNANISTGTGIIIQVDK